MAGSGRGITQEQVWSACEKLFQEGKVVTNEKVRAELGSGSHSTISRHVRAWKERPDAEVEVKNYPIPESMKKIFEEMNNVYWNAFCGKYELIVDNERIDELEKENESLRDKLEVARQDSIRLEQLEKIRKDEIVWREKAIEQQRIDAAEIEKLKHHIDDLTSSYS